MLKMRKVNSKQAIEVGEAMIEELEVGSHISKL
jgi:hypothetical protein